MALSMDGGDWGQPRVLGLGPGRDRTGRLQSAHPYAPLPSQTITGLCPG